MAIYSLQEEKNKYNKICNEAYDKASSEEKTLTHWLDSPWKSKLIICHGFYGHYMIDFFIENYKPEPKSTGVAIETLKDIGRVVSSTPPGNFTVHSGKFDCKGTTINLPAHHKYHYIQTRYINHWACYIFDVLIL